MAPFLSYRPRGKPGACDIFSHWEVSCFLLQCKIVCLDMSQQRGEKHFSPDRLPIHRLKSCCRCCKCCHLRHSSLLRGEASVDVDANAHNSNQMTCTVMAGFNQN